MPILDCRPLVPYAALLLGTISPASGPGPSERPSMGVHAAPDTIRYELRPVGSDSARDIEVRVSIRGARPARTLELPGSWAGWPDHYKSIVDVTVSAAFRADSNPSTLILDKPSDKVEVTYRVHQDWTGAFRRPQYFRAISQPAVAVLTGQNALVVPGWDDADPIVVNVAWRDLPPGWSAVSSFGTGNTRARTTIADLRNALFSAGAFHIEERQVRARPVVIARYGRAPVTDAQLADVTGRLLAEERRFWQDDDFPTYLVLALPIASGLGGTAFTNAVTLYADSASRRPAVAQTLAHELMHAWIGHRLRMSGDEGLTKWFSEGFTDYYANRLARAAGVMTEDDYLARVNATLREYYLSPARNAPRDTVATRYWSDPAMNRLPYTQGYLLAALLHDAVLSAGDERGLDGAMATLLRTRRGAPFTEREIIDAFPKSVRARVQDLIARHIDRGETIPFGGGFGGCYTATQTPMTPFALGFDGQTSTRTRVVSGVVPGSPADSAGLRNGQKLAGWSWVNDDTTRPVELTIADSAGNRKVAYFAKANRIVQVPVLAVGGCGR